MVALAFAFPGATAPDVGFETIRLSSDFFCEGASFGDFDQDGVNDIVAFGSTITGVVMTLGFSTSQHFATMFRRHTHMTPREFRRGAGPFAVAKHVTRP